MANIDWDDAVYRELESEASKDDRVGDHTFMVSEVRHETWPSGDPRIKVLGVLTTARNAKCDITMSPLPSPEVIKAEKDSWDTAKKKGIALAISIQRALAKEYGKSIDTLQQGDEIKVKAVKNKDGFIRIAAVLPKGASTSKAASDVPF